MARLRPAARRVLFGARRATRRHRRLADPELAWRRGLPAELAWWSRWLEMRGAEWPEEFDRLTGPDPPVVDLLLIDAIERLGHERLAILDVGAGPLSIVGTRHPGTSIELTAVDPLADDYNAILDAHGLTPAVRTIACRGEELLDRFPAEHFDIAHGRNAVDHAIDPVGVIGNMLGVVRVGGFLVLRHLRNEGEAEGYATLHQWNFDVQDGRLVVWGRGGDRRDVERGLPHPVRAECAVRWGWVECLLERLG